MEKKYIIQIPKTADRIIVVGIDEDRETYTYGLNVYDLDSYTEPDLEQVRKEAYDKCRGDVEMLAHKLYSPKIDGAYQQGLNDAWAAARKIASDNAGQNYSIFGQHFTAEILNTHSAIEAIEKIRQYEQKQEEIQVGNEIKCDNERYVVLQKYLNNIDEPMAVLFNRRDGKISVFHLYNGNGAIFEKTGRHFPEIAEVLRKMREE